MNGEFPYQPPYPMGGTDGEPEPRKPKCKLVGTDGNVFALTAKVTQALRSAGQDDKCQEFNKRLLVCKSYDDALVLMLEYVDVD